MSLNFINGKTSNPVEGDCYFDNNNDLYSYTRGGWVRIDTTVYQRYILFGSNFNMSRTLNEKELDFIFYIESIIGVLPVLNKSGHNSDFYESIKKIYLLEYRKRITEKILKHEN